MPYTAAEMAELEELRTLQAQLAAQHLDRELDRYRTPRAMRWGPADYRDSALEILALAAGHPQREVHPLTERRLAARRDWGTVDLVRDILAAQLGDHVLAWTERQILAGGVGTPVLGDLYGETANRRILSRMPRVLDKLSAICAPIELNDYRPMTTGTFELEVGIGTATDSIAREWQTMIPKVATEAVGLYSTPVRLRFTEQFVTDDNMGALASIIDAVMLAAAQNELRDAFGTINANGNLSDGTALFTTANTVTGAGKNAAAIDSGIAKLRAQTLNGAATDAEPSALLVPAADEGTARALLASMAAGSDWLRLVGSAWLTPGQWILAADPAIFPTVLRGTMRGSGGASLRFSPGTPNEREGTRDVILEGAHTYRYQALSRVGIVKIEVS